MWLLATHRTKLKNFIMGGTKVELLAKPETDDEDVIMGGDLINDTNREGRMKVVSWSDPLTDAERHIPRAWKTVDRVLEIRIFVSRREQRLKKGKGSKSRKRVEVEDEDVEDPQDERQRADAYERGDEPDAEYLEDIDAWQKRTGNRLSFEDANLVIWAFFKWDDLGYEEGARLSMA